MQQPLLNTRVAAFTLTQIRTNTFLSFHLSRFSALQIKSVGDACQSKVAKKDAHMSTQTLSFELLGLPFTQRYFSLIRIT